MFDAIVILLLLANGVTCQEGNGGPMGKTASQEEGIVPSIDLDATIKEFQRWVKIEDEKAKEGAKKQLLNYIDTLETAIAKSEKESEKLLSLKQKRDLFIEKVGKILEDNATTKSEKWGDVVETVLSGSGHHLYSATELLVRVNDAKAIDKVIGHIDKHWSASGASVNWTGGGLLFHMGWRYPVATALSRSPERCKNLVMARLLDTIKNTDDDRVGRCCTAVIIELRHEYPRDTVSYLESTAEKEKDETKKNRLKKRAESLSNFLNNLIPGEDGRGGLVD